MNDWAEVSKSIATRLFREIVFFFGGTCYLLFLSYYFRPDIGAFVAVNPFGAFATNIIGATLAYVAGRLLYLMGKVLMDILFMLLRPFGLVFGSDFPLLEKMFGKSDDEKTQLFQLTERIAHQRIFLRIAIGFLGSIPFLPLYKQLLPWALAALVIFALIEEVRDGSILEKYC